MKIDKRIPEAVGLLILILLGGIIFSYGEVSAITLVISIVVNFYVIFRRNEKSKKVTPTKILFLVPAVFFFKNFIEQVLSIGLIEIVIPSPKNLFSNLVAFLIVVVLLDKFEDNLNQSVKKENFTAPTKNYLEFRSGIMFKIDKRKSEKKIFNEYKSQIEDEFLKLKINPNIIDWDNCFIDKEILCIVNKENKKFAEYEELEKNKWFVFIKK